MHLAGCPAAASTASASAAASACHQSVVVDYLALLGMNVLTGKSGTCNQLIADDQAITDLIMGRRKVQSLLAPQESRNWQKVQAKLSNEQQSAIRRGARACLLLKDAPKLDYRGEA